MGRMALSFAIAGSALAFSFWLATVGMGIYGAFFIFPFFGTPVIAGMMTLRAVLMRNAVPAQATARALEVIALGGMVAPCLGLALMFCRLGSLDRMDGMCGLAGVRDVGSVVGMWAHIWVPAQLGVLVLLARRSAGIAALPWYQAAPTILTLMIAPLLAVLAGAGTWSEINRGGAGTVVFVPIAVAAGSAVVTWTRGRPFATAAALRRLVGVALILGVGLFAALWREPGENRCKSLWTTATWTLLSMHGTGWVFLVFAGVLLLTRDPASDRA